MCVGSWSFRACGGLPRGIAAWRPPTLSRELSCMAHPREGVFRAGRQNQTFVAVPKLKKKHISSTTVSTRILPRVQTSRECGAREATLGCSCDQVELTVECSGTLVPSLYSMLGVLQRSSRFDGAKNKFLSDKSISLQRTPMQECEPAQTWRD